MKPAWKVRRTVVARDDGQRRWDYAYQFLLQWMAEASTTLVSTNTPQQEEGNAGGTVCPRLDRTSTTGPDH
jgi:hypothetical protein